MHKLLVISLFSLLLSACSATGMCSKCEANADSNKTCECSECKAGKNCPMKGKTEAGEQKSCH